MKKKQLVCILLAGACLMGGNVSAKETETDSTEAIEGPYLEPGKEHELDLDGDGITQKIRFESEYVEEKESWHSTMKIYQNDELLYGLEGEEWTYLWQLQQLRTADGKTYLLASSVSDNDWTAQSIVLAQEDEDSLTIMGDLGELSRKDSEDSENFLSGWARIPTSREAEEENTLRMSWMDTIYISGIMHIMIDYEITEDGIQASEPPYALEEADKAWHAIRDFSAAAEPGSEEIAFEVKAGDEVKLTRITAVDGSYYLECTNQDGETGWVQDTDEVLYDAESGEHGYFKEAFFAG